MHQSFDLVPSCRRAACYADATGDGNCRSTHGKLLATDGEPQTFRLNRRIRGSAAAQDHQELFAAVAADGIVAPHRRLHPHGCFPKDVIPREVSVSVVDLLEMIE